MHYTLKLASGQLAYHHRSGTSPGVMFCGGFHSSMQGNKAQFLERLSQTHGWQYTRFDYRGHGLSSGEFAQGDIDQWREDTLTVLDQVCVGPQVLVGSSMGGWLAVLAALARRSRVAGLVGLASAPDFTQELIWQQLDEVARSTLASGQPWYRPSTYDEGEPYAITPALIDSGQRYRVLTGPIELECPVRLIHGLADEDVPYALSHRLMTRLTSRDVSLTLIKNGDHRLSSAAELRTVGDVLANLMQLLSMS